jgi:hypothetical protein
MTLYITPNNILHDDDNGLALSHPMWPENARLATPEEIEAIRNPPKTADQIKAEIQSQIDSFEAQQYMTRGEREAWLLLMVATAADQGVTEPVLYQANKFYKKVKDQDAVIAALRAQL